MADLWLRFRDAGRTLGVLRTLMLAPRWAVRREYVVVVRDLDVPRCGDARRAGIGGLRWTLLDDEASRQLPEINPTLSPSEIRRRLDEGQECLVGSRGSTIVHYRWETTRPAYLPYLGTVFSPGAGDTLAVEAFTLPAYRGRGIHWLATVRMLEVARARGLARSIALIARWHAPAFRVGLEKVSGRVAGTVTRWQIGPLHRLRVTGEVRRTADGLSLAGCRPTDADGGPGARSS